MMPRRHREGGAAAVELALLLPVLLLIIGGIIDFGRFFYAQNVTVNAAAEGARMIALGYPITSSSPGPDATGRISQAMIGVPTSYTTEIYSVSAGGTATQIPSGMWVDNLPCDGAPGGTSIEVRLVGDFNFTLLAPFAGVVNVKPNGKADMRCGG